MDPSDRDRNDLGNDAPRGTRKPTHANGSPGEGDRWLRLVVENSSEIVSIVDPDGTLRYANPTWKRVLGYDPEELVGANVLDHVHPEDLAHVLEETEKALSAGGIVTNKAEYRRRHKDGSWRWVESVGVYLLDDPAVGGVVVLSRDVTERKEAEEALRHSEAEIFSVLESITDAFFAVDHELRFTYVNSQAEALFRRSREDLIGERLWEDPTFYPQYRKAVVEGKTVTFEGYYPPLEKWYSVKAYPSGSGLSIHLQDVTERKEAERTLREAEERYRSLVETVPAVTYTDRAVGSYPDMAIYTSPQIEALVGYSVEEWLDPERDLWRERIHPEDKSWVLAADERSRATGEPFAEEYRLIAKDGRMVWVRDEAALMRNEVGDPLYWQGVLVDVTERKKVEEALKKSEEHFRTLTHNSSDVVTLLTSAGTIRYQSPSIERILGYRPEEMVGDNLFDYVHPDDLERVEMAFAEGLVDPGRRPSAEYRFRHKDGSWIWLESVGTNLLGDPEVGEYVVNSRDVTGRKRAEAELRESEERLRSLADSAFEGILITDGGVILEANRALTDMLGYAPEEMIGRSAVGFVAPEHRDLVRQKIASGAEDPYEIVGVRKDGTRLDLEVRGRPYSYRGRKVRVTAVRDVTERKAIEERLRHQALHDWLTGLPNRQLFLDRLAHALRRTRRIRGRSVAILFMDIDEFKVVNDSLGHRVGDLFLVAVTERLRRTLRPEDTLARFGGDEFTVLLEAVDDPTEVVRVAERIIAELRRPFVVDGRELFAAASIGIAMGEDRTTDPEDLMRASDTAMYRAKKEPSGYAVFDPDMHRSALERLEVENDLRRAIEREEFVLHYQPIVRLEDGRLWGLEALVRWNHPERGLLNPDEFVPVAEESGLVVPMGEGVLREACLRSREWHEEHPRIHPLVMSVNLSARQLSRPDLAETVEGILRETGLDGNCLTLDVTETVYVRALEDNTAALDRLRTSGVGISIDDFGTGYSSLSYLKRLPANAIKVDKTFVKGLGEDLEDTAIVQMIVELAHTLGMEVIAEGVESEDQARLLREMGCDMAQGFYFSKPMPPDEAPEFLAD